MKKLLSILGSVAIAATSASAVVACSDTNGYKQDMFGPKTGILANHKYDQSEIEASLYARAKTLILNNEFGLSDTITKNYIMGESLSQFGATDPNVKNLAIKDVYPQFIDDSSITDANPKINMNGTIGDSGGIVEKIEQSLLDLVKNAIGDTGSDMLQNLINSILSAKGLNNLIGEGKIGQALTEAMSPILQVIGQLNTPTAMTGIPYALTLIPQTLQKYGTITGLASKLIDLLQTYKDKFDGLLKPFIEATDISGLKDSTFSDLQKSIGDTLKDFITGKDANNKDLSTQDAIDDAMRLVSLGGYYLAFFNNGDNAKDYVINDDTTIAEMSAAKKLSDSPYFKTNDGKGFNIAAILKAGTYFVGGNDTAEVFQAKIRKLLQVLLIDASSISTTPKLSEIGTMVSDQLSKVFVKNNTPVFSPDSISQLLVAALAGKDDASKKIFDDIFNNWMNLEKDAPQLKGLSDLLSADVDLRRAFWDDDNKKELTYSLNSMVNIPLYKLLLLAKSEGFYSNGKAGQVGDTDFDKTGLLPSFAGFFTQKSIVELAKEAKSVFKMDDALTNEDLSNYYFLFGDNSYTGDFAKAPSTLNKFLDELLFVDPYNGGKKGVLSEIVQWITEPDAWKNVANKLGYTNNADGSLNKAQVNKKSIMGDILMMLIPKLNEDTLEKDSDVISLDDVIGDANSDDLTFFASGLSSFLGDVLKPTDYNYWMKVMLTNQNIFSINSSSQGPWVDPLGFTYDKFDKNGYIKDMTLKVTFDFSKLDVSLKPGERASLIDLIPLNYKGHSKSTWTFNISRDDFTKAFSFTDIEKN